MLSQNSPIKDIALGDMIARYSLDSETQRVEFILLPADKATITINARRYLDAHEITQLPAHFQPIPANAADSLVQVRLRGDTEPRAFAQGRTLRNSSATLELQFIEQSILKTNTGIRVETHLKHKSQALSCTHVLTWERGCPACMVWTTVRNEGDTVLTLENLSSFSLSGFNPFCADESAENLRLHRLRSAWSAEGRHEALFFEDLQLERSWCCYGAFSERFGQVGSMPVRGYFPFAAVEAIRENVFWGAQIAHPGSWQIELYRRYDRTALSGGLADREFGHWFKHLAPGADFSTPAAHLSCVTGNFDALCNRLCQAQASALNREPESEQTLGIVFNEWCSTWGEPSHDYIIQTCKRLKQTSTRYFVIDDGWAVKPAPGIQQNGDWIIDEVKFPQGLKATCDAIREHGLIPGLWFEFEACMPGTEAWEMTHLHLHRDGEPLQIGTRRFWDFRKAETLEHLSRKVIDVLKDNGFGYLKVDYNETLGIGCDGAESLGEGLLQHLAGVQQFFAMVREAVPEIVIENCSSGGHRLEPSMMALCSMGSFSDAHETLSIPIMAANLHRVILPRQSQVWAVLRGSDSPQRLAYSLAATFLGRMCISGDIISLSDEQLSLLCEAQKFYQLVSPAIADGTSHRFGQTGKSYTHPTGWQAMLRVSADQQQALLVHHTFDSAQKTDVHSISLPSGKQWRIEASFNPADNAKLNNHQLSLGTPSAWNGRAYWLVSD